MSSMTYKNVVAQKLALQVSGQSFTSVITYSEVVEFWRSAAIDRKQ